jgi:GDPmannose 4,6-dehydratase
MKTAIITGIGGQDGSYLAEFLLKKGYKLYGILRRDSSKPSKEHIAHIAEYLEFREMDILDSSSLRNILLELKPDEIYNLTGQSSVALSWKDPEYTTEVNAKAVVNLLNAIKETGLPIKLFQASSAEMFGNVDQSPQNEHTPFRPQNPYGESKLSAYRATVDFRESYGVFVCNGILFNHESPRRKESFVTRKITSGLASIRLGLAQELALGNLEAQRDWGYAPEYVEAMWLMLQKDKPDDYVLASGETHTIREFVEEAARVLGMDILWQGSGVDEVGVERASGHVIVRIDPQFYRPIEAGPQWGDSTKAKQELGWEPKIKFSALVKIMVNADFTRLSSVVS